MEGRGESAGPPAPATGHALARIPINFDRQLVHRHSILRYIKGIILWYICSAKEGREASAGSPAPATGHAPVRIPINIDL